jgi:hypothetical protein
MAQIPALEHEKWLPLSFRLLTAKPIKQQEERNLFVMVDAYQGMDLVRPFHKPMSKILDLRQVIISKP